MKIKRYFAADMRQALQKVSEEQGPDAVILSNRKVAGGVEIMAAVDYDEELVRRTAEAKAAATAAVATPRPAAPARAAAKAEAIPAEQPKEAPAPRKERPVAAKPAAIVWSQDPALTAMRQELKTLRGIMESQLSGLAWREFSQHHPLRVKLLERLMSFGLGSALCRHLADEVRFGDDEEHNWRQALGLLARRIPVTNDDILTHGGVVALVGPTGVGKTTTVAKLAARYTLRHGPGRVALISTDSYRIGAQHQLMTFGRILGAPVHNANSAEELAKVLDLVRDKSLVLIDTAGMSPSDVRLTERLAMLGVNGMKVKSYAVLSAATQRVALEETVRAFGKVRLDGCILTKVDESSGLGEALSVVAQRRLPVAYLSDGQRVPEDLQPARANNLVTRGVALMRRHSEAPQEEALAFTFGNMVSSAHG